MAIVTLGIDLPDVNPPARYPCFSLKQDSPGHVQRRQAAGGKTRLASGSAVLESAFSYAAFED
jgi:hypothetical protein